MSTFSGRGTPNHLAPRRGHGDSTLLLLKLRLLTYNTFSCDPAHTASQTEALLAVLDRARADVIALQEVSQQFYRALQRWAAAAAAKGKEKGGGWTMTSLEQVWDAQGPDAPSASPGRKRGTREACVLLVREALLLGEDGGGGDGSNGGEVRMAKLDKSRDEGGKAAIGFRLIRDGHEVVSLVSLLALAFKTDQH